jgi:hypothetical protein
LVDALRNAGARVEMFHDHFTKPVPPDHVWLADIGRRGWCVLGRDKAQRYDKLEKEAIRSAGVARFCLVGKRLGKTALADAYRRALPRMRKFVAKYRPPYFAKVYRDGAVKMVANWGGPHAARP